VRRPHRISTGRAKSALRLLSSALYCEPNERPLQQQIRLSATAATAHRALSAIAATAEYAVCARVCTAAMGPALCELRNAAAQEIYRMQMLLGCISPGSLLPCVVRQQSTWITLHPCMLCHMLLHCSCNTPVALLCGTQPHRCCVCSN
jgi:hypothetical protein